MDQYLIHNNTYRSIHDIKPKTNLLINGNTFIINEYVTLTTINNIFISLCSFISITISLDKRIGNQLLKTFHIKKIKKNPHDKITILLTITYFYENNFFKNTHIKCESNIQNNVIYKLTKCMFTHIKLVTLRKFNEINKSFEINKLYEMPNRIKFLMYIYVGQDKENIININNTLTFDEDVINIFNQEINNNSLNNNLFRNFKIIDEYYNISLEDYILIIFAMSKETNTNTKYVYVINVYTKYMTFIHSCIIGYEFCESLNYANKYSCSCIKRLILENKLY